MYAQEAETQSSATSQTEEYDWQEWRNDITITAGPWSAPNMVISLFGQTIINATPIKDYASIGNVYISGNYGLNYHYQLKRWFALGAKVTYEWSSFNLMYSGNDAQVHSALMEQLPTQTKTNTNDYSDNYRLLGQSYQQAITAMFSMQFTYLNKRLVKLYSGIDLGAGVAIWERKNVWNGDIPETAQAVNDDLKKINDIKNELADAKKAYFIPAFNLTPIGVKVGTRVYGMAELNIGFESLIKLGIGARF